MSTQNEHPVLMNGEMVRAILDGRKTQTRRLVKPPFPIRGECDLRWIDGSDHPEIYGAGGAWLPLSCPFGRVGDRLWVRETWRPIFFQGGTGGYVGTVSEHVEYRASEGKLLLLKCTVACDGTPYVEHSDGYGKAFRDACYWSTRTGGSGRWRPSIHMPRWASRLTLEITGVRVERVQSISEDDAKAEGFTAAYREGSDEATYIEGPGGFRWAWDRLYAKSGLGWDANPWIWVLSVKKIGDVVEGT